LQKTVVELNHLRVRSVKAQKKPVKMPAGASMWQPNLHLLDSAHEAVVAR
jgi:hypothetical protein